MKVRNERGFALPLTILVVTVMTMLIASAHVRVRADRVIAESSGATVSAFSVAQSGLHRYFAYYDSIKVRPPDGDSLRVNVNGGFADVVAYEVRTPADTLATKLYIVRSHGTLIEPTRGSDPQAQRTVAQFAQWQEAALKTSAGVLGAITAANGLTTNTTYDLEVRGHDQCTTNVNIPGVRIPWDPSISFSDFGHISGAPSALISGDSGLVVASETEIDWPSIVGGQFDAEYNSFRAWDPSYPTMLINGDLTITSSGGYGLLIVRGDLTLNGIFFWWRGLILVGGRIQNSTDITYVRGVTTTGLNEQLGMSPLPTELGGSIGGQYYRNNHCYVRRALEALVGFAPIENAWMDNWAMY